MDQLETSVNVTKIHAQVSPPGASTNHLSIILEKCAFLWHPQLGIGRGLFLIATIPFISTTALGLEGVSEWQPQLWVHEKERILHNKMLPTEKIPLQPLKMRKHLPPFPTFVAGEETQEDPGLAQGYRTNQLS